MLYLQLLRVLRKAGRDMWSVRRSPHEDEETVWQQSQPTKLLRIGNQIKAASIGSRPDFVNVRCAE